MTSNRRIVTFLSLAWMTLLLSALWLGTSWLSTSHAQLLVSPFEKTSPETQHDLLAIQYTASEVAARVLPATVGLQLDRAMGSGVVINEDGLILTAAHVVSQPGREVVVTFPDGRSAKAVSLGLHTSADGAMVKIVDKGKWPFVPVIENQQAPKVGDWCLALGHPGGFDAERGPPLRLGRIIASKSTVLRTDCTITGGDSGGPLVDMQGRVIGIHSRITESLTENYHVPATSILEAWDTMLAGNLFPQPLPSEFLSMLDANDDGKLTRGEQTSEYRRRVFDRLVAEFGLDVENVSIEDVTAQRFQWQEATQAKLIEIEDIQEFDQLALAARSFLRGDDVSRLFQQTLSDVQDVTVRIDADGRRVAMGLIVDRDGFVLTKASQIRDGNVACRLADGRKLPATIVASDDDHDLALLHIPATKLPEPTWSELAIKPGTWVAVPDVGGELSSVPVAAPETRMTSIGVVGVTARDIPRTPAMLGIAVDPGVINQAVVGDVLDRGGAAESGMLVGDVVVQVESKLVTSVEDIRSALSDFRAGDTVNIVVQRDKKELDLNVLLRSESYILYNIGQFRMSGRLSRRRDGFASVFQMDAAVSPEVCGGPVVDVNGNVIGLTLARATRIASYAIGYDELQPVLRKLRRAANVELTKTKQQREFE